MSIFKVAEILSEVIIGTTSLITESICDIFSNNSSNKSNDYSESITYSSETDSNYDKTYNYWVSLDYKSQYEYYHNNEVLQRNMPESQFYSTNRTLTAMHVAEWSSKLNRPFINRYDKY
jgi:hypothetical protein